MTQNGKRITMPDLTDDAKKAIADAIRIVREDKFEAWAKTTIGKHGGNPANPGVDPPPPKNDPTDPPNDPSAPPPDGDNKEHSRYWGDIFKD